MPSLSAGSIDASELSEKCLFFDSFISGASVKKCKAHYL